jgi:hypothetical protein
MIELLLVFISKGIATWTLNQVLNEMHAAASGAASVNAKLDRLLASPFVAGKDHLDLARAYPDHSAEQRRAIEDARRSFHAAAAQLNGLEQCLAFYMAGLCSDLLQDIAARRHYYSNALHVIPEYVEERIKSHNTAASRGQAVGILAMAAGSCRSRRCNGADRNSTPRERRHGPPKIARHEEAAAYSTGGRGARN